MGNVLSIITVVFNGETTIEDCLKSVDRLCELGVDFEHIIVDGGSTDGTLEIINQNNRYYRRLLSEPDDGLYDAMNKGIDLSSGSFFMFLNADDRLNSSLSKRCFNFLEECNSDMVVFGISQSNNNRVVRKWIPSSDRINRPLWLEYPHPGFIVNKEYWLNECIKFNTEYKICADLDWMLRHRIKSDNLLIKRKVLVDMNLGGVSTKISNKLKLNLELYQIYKEVLNLRFPSLYLCLRYLIKLKQFFL